MMLSVSAFLTFCMATSPVLADKNLRKVIAAHPSYAHSGNGCDDACDAVLLHEDILITAAHCAGAFAGQNMLIGATQFSGADAIDTVCAIHEIPHPEYDDASKRNDIMLVK